jgi:hypothetical protein
MRSHEARDRLGTVLLLFIGSFMNCYLLHAQILGDH